MSGSCSVGAFGLVPDGFAADCGKAQSILMSISVELRVLTLILVVVLTALNTVLA